MRGRGVLLCVDIVDAEQHTCPGTTFPAPADRSAGAERHEPARGGYRSRVAHLDWEIKASLLMYVMGAPGGRIVQDDAVGGSGASFHFPLDPGRSPDPTADAGLFAFTGSVVFIGHFGSFVGEVADIEVAAPADGGPDWAMSIRDRDADVRTDAFRLVGAPRAVRRRHTAHLAAGSADRGGREALGRQLPPATTPFEPLTIDLS